MKKSLPYIIYLVLAWLPVSAFALSTPAITMVSSKNAGETIKLNVITDGNAFTIDWGDGSPVAGTEGDNSHALGASKTIKIYGSYFAQLICRGNALTSIDVSSFPDLSSLDLGTNSLTTIDLSKNLALVFLTLSENQLTSIDVSKNTNLAYLTIDKNKITSLNLTSNTKLEKLYVSYNSLTTLDLSKNTLITDIDCGGNQLTAIDLSALTKLAYFSAISNKFTSLDFSNNKVVKGVELSFNYTLKTVDLSGAAILELLKLSSTLVDVNYLSLPSTAPLKILYCDNTGITSITLTKFPELTYLNVSKNKFPSAATLSHSKLTQLEISDNSELESLDLTGCPGLKILYCINGILKSLYLPQTSLLQTLYLYNQNIQGLDVSNLTSLKSLDLRKNNNGLSILPVPNVNWTSYTYAPQNKVVLPQSVPVNYSVDLSNQLKSTGAQTVFTWKTKGGVTLVNGTDYTISSGATTFLKAQTDSVYCEISNSQFPLLSGANALLTTNIKVAAIPFAGEGQLYNPFQIATLSDLRFLSENPAIWQKAYVQTANIDAADTKNWNNGKGFYPIGTYYRSFGWYDGQGYTISNLYINRPNAKSPEFVGLFGYVGGSVNNLGLLNCDITGNDQVGTLAGLTVGNISNCYATGKINGYSKVGGLIGNLGSSNIVENCYTAVEVTSTFIGGGFAGTGFGTIKNCYSRGNVTATKNYAGGFIGDSWATIKNCYSTGTATSPYNAGGFAGYVDKGTITKCFRDGQTSLNTINIGGSSTGTSVDITSTNTSIMKTNTTFTGAGWDFINETTNGTDDIWTIYTGANDSYPCFVWQTPVPKVVTVKPTQIKNIRATCNGIINDLGSPTPTSYGFCWSKTNTLPTVNDSKVNLGAATQTGAFASIITGLTPVSAYYVRAYAQNAFGISYGSAVYFATSSKIQLTVSAPAVTLTKKYDGTTTAVVTAGTLSGVESGDVVKVSATADYEDANAGKDKKIIVTYTLTGANAAEYFEPDNDTIKNGEITKVQLTSTVPVFVSQKVYDGTTQVNITAAGTISGIVSADAGNVSVSESVLFDNSNVGSDKKIIVAYNLSGTSANNYTAPVNKEFTNGQISQIQLTIAEPVIVTGKLYDGTSEAVITSIGKLTGVVAADAADITVSAKATYNDATVGEGKTITVIYTVDGLRKANYIAPANYMVNTGVIEDKIVLASIDPVTAECDGSGIEIKYSVLQGKPTDYQIIFGEKAKTKGFTNIVYTALPSGSNTLNITVPNDAAGTFDATLQMKSALSTGEVYPFSFTVNLTSDFIIKKFDDVVLCDNGSKEFTAFQWYKDGTAISGATKQFYNDKSGLVGNYQVKVTTRNSESLITCPLSLNVPLAAQSVKAFPNALSPSQEFKVQLSNFSDESLQGAVLTLFNAYGNAICKQVLSSSEVSLSAPAIHGSYIGHVVTMDGKDFTFRVQVNQ